MRDARPSPRTSRARGGEAKARGESLSEKSERAKGARACARPPARPAAFDVLEAQDTRAFDESESRRRANPKPRRAAEEGAPRSNVPSVPSAPPASPSRRNGSSLRSPVATRRGSRTPASSLASVRAAPSAAALISVRAPSRRRPSPTTTKTSGRASRNASAAAATRRRRRRSGV